MRGAVDDVFKWMTAPPSRHGPTGYPAPSLVKRSTNTKRLQYILDEDATINTKRWYGILINCGMKWMG